MLSNSAGSRARSATAATPIQRRACVAGVAALATALTALSVLPASAAPGETATDTSVANVIVGSVITLTGLTSSFNLSGIPGATVSLASAVTMNVETNNIAGYAVTVQAESDTLDPADTVANPDTIPIGALSVRETGTTSYTPVSDAVPVTVHSQGTRSADGGDTVNNDYQVVIPFVNADTYSVTLDYVATTL